MIRYFQIIQERTSPFFHEKSYRVIIFGSSVEKNGLILHGLHGMRSEIIFTKNLEISCRIRVFLSFRESEKNEIIGIDLYDGSSHFSRFFRKLNYQKLSRLEIFNLSEIILSRYLSNIIRIFNQQILLKREIEFVDFS